MNSRLQHRLLESEILKIFSDISVAVSCMHFLNPPLVHRDLKVENVLISTSSRCYKLCDFGSASEAIAPGKDAQECRKIDQDIQKHTTLQYRSPEMTDVYRKLPIDEKSDIWALGVFLYKLCYYTTPFEEGGQLAILNGKFSFPSYPSYSTGLKVFIQKLLAVNPNDRPTIYDVVKNTAIMRGVEIPIRNPSELRGHLSQPIPRMSQRLGDNQFMQKSPAQSTTQPLISYSAITKASEMPNITPMRRGRVHNSYSSPDVHEAQLQKFSERFPDVEKVGFTMDEDSSFDLGVNNIDEKPKLIQTVSEPKMDLRKTDNLVESNVDLVKNLKHMSFSEKNYSSIELDHDSTLHDSDYAESSLDFLRSLNKDESPHATPKKEVKSGEFNLIDYKDNHSTPEFGEKAVNSAKFEEAFRRFESGSVPNEPLENDETSLTPESPELLPHDSTSPRSIYPQKFIFASGTKEPRKVSQESSKNNIDNSSEHRSRVFPNNSAFRRAPSANLKAVIDKFNKRDEESSWSKFTSHYAQKGKTIIPRSDKHSIHHSDKNRPVPPPKPLMLRRESTLYDGLEKSHTINNNKAMEYDAIGEEIDAKGRDIEKAFYRRFPDLQIQQG